jgi:hypothetical protein
MRYWETWEFRIHWVGSVKWVGGEEICKEGSARGREGGSIVVRHSVGIASLLMTTLTDAGV